MIAFVLFVPAITSAPVASWTPPTLPVEAGAREIKPPTTSIPLPTTTAPNCVVEAADRLIVTAGPDPPPERPVPTVMLLIVPVPGGRAFKVPSGRIVKFAPGFMPPKTPTAAGTRLIVPETVIVPPESPVPAVTAVTVPPNAEAIFNIPN